MHTEWAKQFDSICTLKLEKKKKKPVFPASDQAFDRKRIIAPSES